jgi:hypothetical protein
MAAEFFGQEGIGHVTMPADSELCFAAGIAAVSGTTINEAHAALRSSHLSKENGETSAMLTKKHVIIGDRAVFIHPLETPLEGTGTTTGIVERIFSQLDIQRPVAVLSLHERSDTSEFLHWTLVKGYWQEEGTTTSVEVMDPLQRETSRQDLDSFIHMIDRSLPLPGAYTYALNVARPDMPV